MHCSEIKDRLDDYLDGCSPAAEYAAIGSHARRCAPCADILGRERKLRERLRRLPVPEPDMAVFSRAIAAAARAEDHQRKQQRRWNLTGAALAATVVLALGLGLKGTLSGGDAPDHPLLADGGQAQEAAAGSITGDAQPLAVLKARPAADIVLALDEERELSLALESQQRIEEATFTVILPEGVELSGYPGQREITWIGSLESGKNLLVLPLKARAGNGGELTTHIMHTERRRSLILHADVVTPSPAPALLPAEPVTVM